MLNVVTFLWSKPGYRSKFTLDHVATMARMVRRHYTGKHRLICFTDQLGGSEPCFMLDKEAPHILYPLWTDYADVPHPTGAHNPSCFRRLRLYSNWAREHIGARILQIDLDMVLTGDVTPLWDRTEPFVFWQDQLNRHGRINGAMQLITPGVRDDVWSGFDPARAAVEGRKEGQWGSDQGWLAANFPPGSHGAFTAQDGAVSWRVHCKPQGGALPAGARVVIFHGAEDPWTLAASVPWIKENYR